MVNPTGGADFTRMHFAQNTDKLQNINDLETLIVEGQWQLKNDIEQLEAGVNVGPQVMKDLQGLNAALSSPLMAQVVKANPQIESSVKDFLQISGLIIGSKNPNLNELNRCSAALTEVASPLHPHLGTLDQLKFDSLQLQYYVSAMQNGDQSVFPQVLDLLKNAQGVMKSPDMQALVKQHPEIASSVNDFIELSGLVINSGQPNMNDISQANYSLSAVLQDLGS